MGSPVTFSGFNQINFNAVLSAVMQQESQPLQILQSQQQALQTTDSALGQLASRLDALHTAASGLSSSTSLTRYAARTSDAAAVSVSSALNSAVAGRYEIVVTQLARAQVTASATTAPDVDTTVVATGGTITIGGVAVTLSGSVTLLELASQINSTPNVPASASIVETSPGAFRLVLTGNETGTANAFTVANALTGSAVTFTDTDGDGTSGDSAADNAVQATNASAVVNNIAVTSGSNTLDSGVPGVSVTLQQQDATKTVVVTVGQDDQSLISGISDFATAYNDLVTFANAQAAAAGNGKPGTLGHDAMLRNLRHSLSAALSAAYGSGTYTHLAEIGVGFNRNGQLTVHQATLAAAIQAEPSAVNQLVADANSGAFASIDAVIAEYQQSGGFVAGARTRLADQLGRVGKRLDDIQLRLAVRKAALQQEFIAADQAMSRLNAQSGLLSSFNASLSSSKL
jgi:flagellar hook-associated protein 2